MSPWVRLLRLLAPWRRVVLFALGLAALACLLSIAAPLFVERLLRIAVRESSWHGLLLPALAFCVTVVLQAVAGGANAWLLGDTALEVARTLRQQIYGRAQRLPLAWFDRTPTGAIMSRLMDDVAVVQGLLGGETLRILIEVSTALGAAVWLGLQSWRLLAVVALLAPLYLWIFRYFSREIHSGTHDVRQRLDEVFGHLKQKIDGMLVVRATSADAAEVASFTRQIADLHQPRVRVNQQSIAFNNLCFGIGGLGAAILFAVGTWEVAAGRLSTGQLIAATALTGLLFAPITRFATLATLYQQASTSLDRLGQILDLPSAEEATPDQPAESTKVLGAVQFDSVDFQYLPGRPILRHVSLQIEPGQKVAVVGPTGSGKSTLAHLLLRFYEPTAGEIRLDGQPLARFGSRVTQHIGLVPQETVIFRGTLAENIRYGTPDADRETIERAARAAGVDAFARNLPQGYDTLVGEGGQRLSLGEQQRLAVARLFCKDPAVILLDEATSALDSDSEALVQQALDRLLAGRTTLIIAHRLATVLNADRIVVMDQGKIVQAGTHAELLADEGGLYRQLFECQFAPTFDPLSETNSTSALSFSASQHSRSDLVPA